MPNKFQVNNAGYRQLSNQEFVKLWQQSKTKNDFEQRLNSMIELDRILTSRSFHTLQSSALDKLRRRKRGSRECGGDAGARDWCRETVFPELYFGGLVEALEEHMANGDLVFPEGK